MKTIKVGRNPENDIVINDKFVGRCHCEFIQDNKENYWIIDLNSKNGTFVNGRQIKGKVPIRWGDEVRIGNTTLQWMDYFPHQSQIRPTHKYTETNNNDYRHSGGNRPLVEIPSEININKKEEHISAEVRKRGDDFSVGFFRRMGDNIGNLLGNTIGCILSIILFIAFFAIIAAIAG